MRPVREQSGLQLPDRRGRLTGTEYGDLARRQISDGPGRQPCKGWILKAQGGTHPSPIARLAERLRAGMCLHSLYVVGELPR